MSIETRVRAGVYEAAIRRASEFLRSRVRADGSVDGVDSVWGYYSQPLALISAGSTADWRIANLLLDYVAENFTISDNTLRVAPLPFVGDFYPYAYLIRGAVAWGRFDLARKWIGPVLTHQHPGGGILYRAEGSPLIDPAVTAHGGIAMLATGFVDEARRAGDFIMQLHSSQTRPTEEYSISWDVEIGGPVSSLEAYADAPWGSGSILRPSNPSGANAYWDIGFILGFLTALYLIDRRTDYLRVATEMFDIFAEYEGFLDHPWKTPWGCAALFRVTNDDRHLSACLRMADAVCEFQQSDGGFYLGASSNYVDEEDGSWSRSFTDYEELRENRAILSDTAAQMTHYLAQVRAVMPNTSADFSAEDKNQEASR